MMAIHRKVRSDLIFGPRKAAQNAHANRPGSSTSWCAHRMLIQGRRADEHDQQRRETDGVPDPSLRRVLAPIEEEDVREEEAHEEELQVAEERRRKEARRWKEAHRFEHEPLEDRGEHRSAEHERAARGCASDREDEREQGDEQVELDLDLKRPRWGQDRVQLSAEHEAMRVDQARSEPRQQDVVVVAPDPELPQMRRRSQ